jgi:nucleoside-diphosphate-sugar epimerase
LPSIQSPLGALPARFRRSRLAIVGCGDVGLRVVQQLQAQGLGSSRSVGARMRVLALTSSPDRVPALRAQGITPLLGNLDAPRSLRRLAGLATRVLHLAPPPTEPPSGTQDPRTQALLRALRLRSSPLALVYGSTSAVYGDLRGALAHESSRANPQSNRAKRRADAENAVRQWGRATGTRVALLRIPGIYAPNRVGGTPRERLQKALPVLRREDDVFTNHIHADDLASASIAALFRAKTQRAYNVNDDTELLMGDYFDLAASIYRLPRPPRVTREQAKAQLSPMQMSFMNESRRMDNTRLKRELRVRLRFAHVGEGLRSV